MSSRGPFDRVILEICEKPHLLTETNIEQLRTVVPERPAAEDPTVDNMSLAKVFNQLYRTATTLYRNAQSSNDAAELKAASASLQSPMKMSLQYAEKIEANERAQKVEAALIEAVSSFGDPDLNERFLAHCKEFLTH